MSLAMYASEFNNEENNVIQKKREVIRNKTLKRRDNVRSSATVDALMKKIHEDDEENSNLSDYQPLGPPNSAGIERLDNDNGNGMDNVMENGMEERMKQQQNLPTNNYNQSNLQEGFTQLPSEYAKQYYQQYVPYFNQGSDDLTPNGVNKDELLTKLNQIIYLLEEQQDEKTGHVTEELILYSFLGVFIIFIVDSFARVGKYVR